MPTQLDTITINNETQTIPVRIPYLGGETVAFDGTSVWIDSVSGDFSAMEEGGYLFIEVLNEYRQIKFINKHEFDVVANPAVALSVDEPFSVNATGQSFSFIPRSKYKKITVYCGAASTDITIDGATIPFSNNIIPFVEYGNSEMGPAHHPIGPIQIDTADVNIVVACY